MKTIRLSLLTLILAFLVFNDSNGQLNKGAFLLGTNAGTYGYNSNSSLPDEYVTSRNGLLNLKSRLGYFITKNAVLGLGYDYQNNFRKDETQRENIQNTDNSYISRSSKYNLNQHFLRLFYRQNFRIVKNLYGYVEPSVFYSSGYENHENLNYSLSTGSNEVINTSTSYSDTETSQWGITVLPGLMYMVKPWLGVELSAGLIEYSKVNSKFSSLYGSNLSVNEDYTSMNSSERSFDRIIADLSFNTFSLGVNFYFKNSPLSSQEN